MTSGLVVVVVLLLLLLLQPLLLCSALIRLSHLRQSPTMMNRATKPFMRSKLLLLLLLLLLLSYLTWGTCHQ
jgi:hypothetical protein